MLYFPHEHKPVYSVMKLWWECSICHEGLRTSEDMDRMFDDRAKAYR